MQSHCIDKNNGVRSSLPEWESFIECFCQIDPINCVLWCIFLASTYLGAPRRVRCPWDPKAVKKTICRPSLVSFPLATIHACMMECIVNERPTWYKVLPRSNWSCNVIQLFGINQDSSWMTLNGSDIHEILVRFRAILKSWLVTPSMYMTQPLRIRETSSTFMFEIAV